LLEALAQVAQAPEPVLLHVKTVKGKGLEAAEGDATTFHSPKPFTITGGDELRPEGCRVEVDSGGRSFTAAYADAMVDLMERDASVVTCTAAMPDGTGLAKALERYPERSWDVGICESHAMDMMAGLAKTRRSSSEPSTRPSRRSRCRACPCACASTARGSSAATARCTTDSAT